MSSQCRLAVKHPQALLTLDGTLFFVDFDVSLHVPVVLEGPSAQRTAEAVHFVVADLQVAFQGGFAFIGHGTVLADERFFL